MNGCEQIYYQQWVDMYNQKDKECFDLQLKLSRIEEYISECCHRYIANDKNLCYGCQYDEEVCDYSIILKIIRGEE